MPAAAVRQRDLALFGMTGLKGCVGGYLSRVLNPWAQPKNRILYWVTRVWERRLEFLV